LGRRDLIRRERSKLAPADAAGAGVTDDALPAWLSTGGRAFVCAPASANLTPARSGVGPRPAQAVTWQTTTSTRRALRPRVPFDATPLLELVQQRAQARAIVRQLDTEIADAVGRARATGALWSQIATCLGVTRQGARQRYGVNGAQARGTGLPSTESPSSRAAAAARH